LEKNRDTLATFLRYSFEQGLSKQLLKPEQLFAPRRSSRSRSDGDSGQRYDRNLSDFHDWHDWNPSRFS